MPFYRNNQPATILINNSFSSKNSGEKVVYEKGSLFSNSGFLDNSYYFRNSGEIKDKGDSYLFLEGCPKSLYATGARILKEEELETEVLSEDKFHFFSKSINSESQRGQNEDLFLFKNSGEYPIFNCYLSKIKDKSFVLKIFSGTFNDTPLINKPCKTISIENAKGQKIYTALYEKNSSDIQIESYDNLSFEDGDKYGKDGSDNWAFSDNFSLKIPLCVVDFDRESVSTLYNSNLDIENDESSLGINGSAFTSII